MKEQLLEIETSEGVRLRFSGHEHIPLLYLVREIIERRIYTLSFDDLTGLSDGWVIDIGANVGLFSVWVSSHYGCKVCAIEMDNVNFELLEYNVAQNRSVCSVACYNQAIYPRNGVVKYYHAYDLVGSRIIENEPHNGGESVASITLKDFLEINSIGEVSLLKMDCEGSEYDILLSLEQTQFEKIRRLNLEYHIQNEATQSLLKKTVLELKKHYNKVSVIENELRPWLGMIYAE